MINHRIYKTLKSLSIEMRITTANSLCSAVQSLSFVVRSFLVRPLVVRPLLVILYKVLMQPLSISKCVPLTLFFSSVLVVGCVGKPAPETQYYLLRMEDTPVEKLPVSKISLSSLEVAPYLKQTGLIMDRGDGQIIPARYHQWSEPLDFSIQNFLQRSLSVLYGEEFLDHRSLGAVNSLTPVMSLSINIDQLHGTVGGTVKLVASWTLRKGQQAAGSGELIHHRFVDSQPLTEDGYRALVEVHRALLQKLSVAIVKSLPKEVDQPLSGPRVPRETVF